MTTILDLGEKSSKVMIFGGPYSNLQAATEIKEIAERENIAPSNVICTGDCVAYCAQPEETAALIREWGIYIVQGNVEEQISNDADSCNCNFEQGSRCDTLSKKWYPYVQGHVSKDTIKWMCGLPKTISFHMNKKKISVVHGAYGNISSYIFKSTPWDQKQKSFEQTKSDIIVGGHGGIPFSDRKNGSVWINAGVIGMPANDGTARVWYLLLEPTDDGIKIEHKWFLYDNKTASQLMNKSDLPKEYSQTLLTGIWDNCDILPEEEVQEQGKRLELAPILFP